MSRISNFLIFPFNHNSPNTETAITTVNNIPNASDPGYLIFGAEKTITGVDLANNIVSITGNILSELDLAYQEEYINSLGESIPVVVGGIYESATVTEFLDKDSNGNAIPNSHTGVFKIEFDNYLLQSHFDPEVDWYRGIIRIPEDPANLPPPSDPDHLIPQYKTLNVWNVYVDSGSGKQIVEAYDPTVAYTGNPNDPYELDSEYLPVKTGAVNVNFHPGYRLYHEADSANGFNSANLSAPVGSGTHQTFFGVRARDYKENVNSPITTPVILISQEVVVPVAPGLPLGPKYATRPDFYGKATYSFDVSVDTSAGRQPFGLLFYRANERQILDTLYNQTTVATILTELENLKDANPSYLVNRWHDLVNVILDGSDFPQYSDGTFRFPHPDNADYFYFDSSNNKIFPFNPSPSSLSGMEGIIREAVQSAFVPLTKYPVLYGSLGSGPTTSPDPQTPSFSPMAFKFQDSGTSYVRFTDFTLDGAAQNMYFYFGKEFSRKHTLSPVGTPPTGGISGPVLLLNTRPAEPPIIKKVVTQLQDPISSIPTAVRFTIDPYLESENVKEIRVYRSFNGSDAKNLRSMTKVMTIPYDPQVDIVDDFSNDLFVPYGETLFYRLVALRHIPDEFDQNPSIPAAQNMEVPSLPSAPYLTNVVDVVNPPAPVITPTFTVNGDFIEDITLEWSPTCYNGKYYLYKMTDSGNWMKIYETGITNNSTITVDFDLDLDDPIIQLLKLDDNNLEVFHRFKVSVENSSGLLNLTDEILTI